MKRHRALAAARLIALVGLVLVTLPVLAPAAAAHAELADSDPAAGSTVGRLTEIRLTFGGPLDAGAPRAVRLVGPGGNRWDSGPARVQSGRVLTVAVDDALPARGEYTVRWCAASADGHPQAGQFSFDYRGPVAADAAPPATSAGPACFARGSGGSIGTLSGWVLIGVAGAAVLFLIAAAARRQLRPRRQRAP